MAENPHLNSVCDLILISGEIEFAAPFVGVSTQVDVMQHFMKTDMLDAMTGAEDITQAPELWEAQGMTEASSLADMQTLAEDATLPTSRGIDDDIYDSEQIQSLIEKIKRPNAEGIVTSEGSRPFVIDDLLLWGPLALLAVDVVSNPVIRKAGSTALKFVGNTAKRVWNWRSSAQKIGAAANRLPATLKNVEARNALWRSLSSGATDASTAAMLLTQELGSTAANFASNLQMASQITNIADAMRMFTPSLAMLYDGFVEVDDALKIRTKLEANGTDAELKIPTPSPGEEYVSVEHLMADAAKGKLPPGMDARTLRDTPVTPTIPTKPSVGMPNINKFSMIDAMRYLCRELSIFEKEFKIFNSRMAMDKDKVPGFLADKKDTILTQDIGIGEILFKALNTIGKKEAASGVMGPTEILSLAEQFKQAFPVIEVVDAITKKKSTVSVFELIMKAQNAKVVELGPGFLKWYTELDVFQHTTGAVTETPKVGS